MSYHTSSSASNTYDAFPAFPLAIQDVYHLLVFVAGFSDWGNMYMMSEVEWKEKYWTMAHNEEYFRAVRDFFEMKAYNLHLDSDKIKWEKDIKRKMERISKNIPKTIEGFKVWYDLNGRPGTIYHIEE